MHMKISFQIFFEKKLLWSLSYIFEQNIKVEGADFFRLDHDKAQ